MLYNFLSLVCSLSKQKLPIINEYENKLPNKQYKYYPIEKKHFRNGFTLFRWFFKSNMKGFIICFVILATSAAIQTYIYSAKCQIEMNNINEKLTQLTIKKIKTAEYFEKKPWWSKLMRALFKTDDNTLLIKQELVKALVERQDKPPQDILECFENYDAEIFKKSEKNLQFYQQDKNNNSILANPLFSLGIISLIYQTLLVLFFVIVYRFFFGSSDSQLVLALIKYTIHNGSYANFHNGYTLYYEATINLAKEFGVFFNASLKLLLLFYELVCKFVLVLVYSYDTKAKMYLILFFFLFFGSFAAGYFSTAVKIEKKLAVAKLEYKSQVADIFACYELYKGFNLHERLNNKLSKYGGNRDKLNWLYLLSGFGTFVMAFIIGFICINIGFTSTREGKLLSVVSYLFTFLLIANTFPVEVNVWFSTQIHLAEKLILFYNVIPDKRHGTVIIDHINSIETKNLNVDFFDPRNKTQTVIIKNGNMNIPFIPGEKKNNIVCFIGSSGQGKTTLMEILTSKREVSGKGAILINGHNMNDIDRANLIERSFVGPQFLNLFQESSKRNIENALPTNPRLPNGDPVPQAVIDHIIKKAAKKTGLAQRLKKLPYGINNPIGSTGKALSGGTKKILLITMLLAKSMFFEYLTKLDPKHPQKILLIALDEITSGLDEATSIIVMDIIYEIMMKNQCLVLLVEHNPYAISNYAGRILHRMDIDPKTLQPIEIDKHIGDFECQYFLEDPQNCILNNHITGFNIKYPIVSQLIAHRYHLSMPKITLTEDHSESEDDEDVDKESCINTALDYFNYIKKQIKQKKF